jgi:choline-sulfatase
MNTVFILSDRHNAEFSGCYGNAISRTPHIDRLAAEGLRFESAYCVSPICSPARAAMMTGRYVHELGIWDNAFSYGGKPEGWGGHFSRRGVRFATVGKLDFTPGCEFGIQESHLATHRDNLDIHSLFREEEIFARDDLFHRHMETGPSESNETYSEDARIADRAAKWLEQDRPDPEPWVLFVNFNNLHRPWNPSQDLWDYYDPLVGLDDLDERFTEDLSRLHPYHRIFIRHHNGERLGDEVMRRALVGYYASCEVLDGHVGRVLSAIDQAGIRDDTLVVYASDHGGACGEHRNWDHGAMYDESIRCPMIFSGPGIRMGEVESSAVSMLDVFPTLCEFSGSHLPGDIRGHSLLGMAQGRLGSEAPDFALTEYHGAGMPSSVFAIRSGQYKFVECVGERPMLFDLKDDPHEMSDLVVDAADDPAMQERVEQMRARLIAICDPSEIDARVKADQRARRQELAESGQLFDEMWKRGYERRSDRLVLRKL